MIVLVVVILNLVTGIPAGLNAVRIVAIVVPVIVVILVLVIIAVTIVILTICFLRTKKL